MRKLKNHQRKILKVPVYHLKETILISFFCFIYFVIGFIIGIIFGLIAFGIFSLIMFLLGNTVIFHIDLYYTTVLFILCIIVIFVFSGYTLRQIGNQKIIQTFSKDIPYNYDASKGLTKIPRWISSRGFNLKIAVVNTIRRKGEFVRYFFVFSMIFFVIRFFNFVRTNAPPFPGFTC